MKLATFFDRWRETIEAAETPFAKLAIFVLPILAPIVPATLTRLHLFKLFSEVLNFDDTVSRVLAVLVGLVLEMLGYVGAVSFVQAVFRLVKTWNRLYILPAALNGLSYAFYLALMYLTNYELGEYFQTPSIVNTFVGLLTFVYVPTGLLEANYLSQKEMKEDEKELRKENREERLEKLRIRAGKVTGNLPSPQVTYEKVTESPTKVSESFPKDWRNLRKILKVSDVQDLANLSADGVKKIAVKYGVDERTV